MVRFYEIESPEEYSSWIGASFSDLERQTRAVDAASGGSPAALSRHFVRKTLRGARLGPRRLGPPPRPEGVGLAPALSRIRSSGPVGPVAVGAVNTAVMILAGIGLLRAPRPRRPRVRAAYLVLSMAVHVALIVVWRYRIASWDPCFSCTPVWAADPGADDLRRSCARSARSASGSRARSTAPGGVATGRGHLPPLWLRRHTGSVSAFESAARETVRLSGPVGSVEGRPGRARRRLRRRARWSTSSGGGSRGRALRGLRRTRALDSLVPDALGLGSASLVRARAGRFAVRLGFRTPDRELPVSGRGRRGRSRARQVGLHASHGRGGAPLPRRDAAGAPARPAGRRHGVPL